MTFAVFALLAALIAVLGWADFRLFVRNGRVLVRIDELERGVAAKAADRHISPPEILPPGSGAIDFALPDTGGVNRTLSDWRGSRVLLTFVSPECPHSQSFMAELGELGSAVANCPLPVLVSSGTVAQNRRMREDYDLECPVLVQEATEVAYVYHVDATPCGYLVDETGTIVSRLARGTANLLTLARGTLPDPMPEPDPAMTPVTPAMAPPVTRSLAVGTPAPALSIRRLDGKELSLDEYRGHDVLVVFSDPDCAPCAEMAPVLEDIHRRDAGPAIIMVSRGDTVSARSFAVEHAISYPVAVQTGSEISRRFGTLATPAAVLIGPAGMIAAAPALGVENIRNLAARAAEAFATLRDKEAVPAPV